MKDNISCYFVIIWLVLFLVGFFYFVIKIDFMNCVLILFVEGFYFELMLVLFVVVFVFICSYVLFISWFLLKLMRNLVGWFNIFK